MPPEMGKLWNHSIRFQINFMMKLYDKCLIYYSIDQKTIKRRHKVNADKSIKENYCSSFSLLKVFYCYLSPLKFNIYSWFFLSLLWHPITYIFYSFVWYTRACHRIYFICLLVLIQSGKKLNCGWYSSQCILIYII